MPTAYLPDEDQGIMFVQAMLPANSTLEQTKKVLDGVREHFLDGEKDAVESIMTMSGYQLFRQRTERGFGICQAQGLEASRPAGSEGRCRGRKGHGSFFTDPQRHGVRLSCRRAVIELGSAKGFDFQLQDRGGLGHAALMAARNQLLGMAMKDPRLTRVRPNGLEDVPEYRIDVDWEKAGALGTPITAIHNTISQRPSAAPMSTTLSRADESSGCMFRRTLPTACCPEDLEKLYVRNTAGKMVPFSSFASGHWTSGSPKLERYNAFPSINIWGEPAPGRSSGEAMQAMEEIVSKLPKGIGFDWTGLSYQERMASSQAPALYAFSMLVIFLVLAALYESWTFPISILLVLPLGVIGGVLASSFRGLPNDVYFQIGLLTTLGLTTKNAILIVAIRQGQTGRWDGVESRPPWKGRNCGFARSS